MNNLEQKQQQKNMQKQTYTHSSKDMRTHIHTC